MNNKVASASPSAGTSCFSIQSKSQSIHFSNPVSSVPVIPCMLKCSSDLKLKGIGFGGAKTPKRITLRCNSSTKPGPPGSGDGDSRTVLDSFFLGKALAEVLNERIESAVGEFLSTIGRLQSEQQKQVQEFQEDVLERAKKTAREAKKAQGLVPKSSPVNTSSASDATSTSPPATNTVSPASPSSSSDPISLDVEVDPDPVDKGPASGVSDKE